MTTYDYDLFVIGAGSGGVRAARMSAALGAKVAIAEERYFGGTCVNVGCVPKKLFVYASEFSSNFAAADGFGWEAANTVRQFEWPTLRNNKDKEIQRLNNIYVNLLEKPGCTIFEGRARIVDAHTVSINGENISAEKILLAVGGWPYIPEFPGSEHAISSNETFHLDQLPEKVIVVGGGYIAVEFAGIYQGLGCEVELVYRGDTLLKRFDHDVSQVITEELRQKSIHVQLESNIQSINKLEDGKLEATFTNGQTKVVDTILYATGRKPLLSDLGLDNVSIDLLANGKIKVDEYFQTSEPSIYALGDIIDTAELTPVALEEGMTFAYTQFGNDTRLMDYDHLATAVFCQPNIGTVGLSEIEARQQHDVVIFKSHFRPMKNTLSGNPEKTFMKLVVDKTTDKVLGIHMVGPEAGEIIQGLAVALKAGATKKVFDATIGIHPTAAEEFVTMRTPCN